MGKPFSVIKKRVFAHKSIIRDSPSPSSTSQDTDVQNINGDLMCCFTSSDMVKVMVDSLSDVQSLQGDVPISQKDVHSVYAENEESTMKCITPAAEVRVSQGEFRMRPTDAALVSTEHQDSVKRRVTAPKALDDKDGLVREKPDIVDPNDVSVDGSISEESGRRRRTRSNKIRLAKKDKQKRCPAQARSKSYNRFDDKKRKRTIRESKRTQRQYYADIDARLSLARSNMAKIASADRESRKRLQVNASAVKEEKKVYYKKMEILSSSFDRDEKQLESHMAEVDASSNNLKELGALSTSTYKGCDAEKAVRYIKKLRTCIGKWKKGDIKPTSKAYLKEFESDLAPPFDPCPAYRMLRAEIQKALGLHLDEGSSVQPLDVYKDRLLCKPTDGSRRYLQQNQPPEKQLAFNEYVRLKRPKGKNQVKTANLK